VLQVGPGARGQVREHGVVDGTGLVQLGRVDPAQPVLNPGEDPHVARGTIAAGVGDQAVEPGHAELSGGEGVGHLHGHEILVT
jgi:hypothetical protein